MDNPGTYALVILCKDRLRLPIGKLSTQNFSPGYYVYVGSALRGLDNRLNRHLKADKLLHWHIDYLLQQTTVIQIWYSLTRDRLECTWNAMLAYLPGATPLLPGFGSSDCKCRTHLTHFSTTPSFGRFKQELENHELPQLYRVIIGVPITPIVYKGS